jgi:hypothetical protein
MGLVQDAHAAVAGYRERADEAAQALNLLAEQVQALAERLSAHGPLGASADPDLARAREHLDAAWSRLLAAAACAEASRAPCQEYVQRALPL